MEASDKYLAFMGLAPKHIPTWEHWSCPDAETYCTGIDYYEHPKLCREKMQEMYPFLELGIPETDDPKPRPQLDLKGESSTTQEDGRHVRWGEGTTTHWSWGEHFRTVEDVFAFSPLEQGDFTDIPVVESADYSSEEIIAKRYGVPLGEPPQPGTPGEASLAGFYNTMFMWPLLTFGWELFLETCLDPRFERIMAEFLEINRRVFRCFARMPVNFVLCHDDICNSRGLTCSPQWMHKYIYPAYEELWGICQAAGQEVLFMTDGRPDPAADDVLACGARGIISEPYGDYQALARKYEGRNLFLAGEGDNRILTRNNPEEIQAMFDRMLETSRMTGGYVMCIGNHIPWNVTPAGMKLYLDLCREHAYRE